MVKRYISCYSRITNEMLSVNGQSILRNNTTNIDDWTHAIYNHLNLAYPKFFKMDLLSKTGILASEVLMRKMSINQEDNKKDWAIIGMNKSSSLWDDSLYQKTIQNSDNYFPSPSVFVYTLANIVIGEIAIKHKIQGETSFYISEQFNAQMLHQTINAAMNADQKLHFVLGGWIEFNDNQCDALLMVVTDQQNNTQTDFTEEALNQLYY